MRRLRPSRHPDVVLLWPPKPDPAMEPWGPLHIDGWSWDTRFSEDENLLNLAYAASLNTYFFQRGMAGGLFGAVLCRPEQEGGAARRRKVQVLGLGVAYPPRFADDSGAAVSTEGGSEAKRLTSRQLTGAKATTLHAEIMVVARCAREGLATEGSSLYVMQPPCWECCKALLMAGVARIVYQRPHRAGDCLRQQEVVAATGAEWLCVPVSEERRRFLDDVFKTWHQRHSLGPRAAAGRTGGG